MSYQPIGALLGIQPAVPHLDSDHLCAYDQWGEMGGFAVATQVNLTGRYRLLNETFLREKADRVDDPRHSFYVAILAHNTYDSYLGEVGETEVTAESYKTGPVSGRMEILYCRRNGWIGDA